MKRIRQEIAAPTRQRSLHPGLTSALLSGAMLTAMAGPLLAPATATAAEAQPAANPSTAVIHTVAYSAQLQSARPPGVVRGSGSCVDADDGSKACLFGPPTSQQPTDASAGTGTAKPKQASTPDSSSSDDPLQAVAQPVHTLSAMAKDVGDGAKSLLDAGKSGTDLVKGVFDAFTSAIPFGSLLKNLIPH